MTDVDVHYIRQFEGHVHHEMSQTQPRALKFCEETTIEGENKAVDSMAGIELSEVTARHQDINEVVPEHKRRKLQPRRYAAAILVDTNDIQSVLMDPDGEYRRELTAAVNRKIDRIILDAAFAAVLTGKEFATSVTYANDGGFTVNATGGLTYATLLEIVKNFTDAEVGNEFALDVGFFLSGDEEEDMMAISQLTSGDFSRQFPVDKGKLTHALGMEVVKFGAAVSDPILAVSGGTRDCLVLQKGGIKFGMKGQISIVVENLPGKTQTHKIEAIINAGAVRKEGVMVQKFQVTDA